MDAQTAARFHGRRGSDVGCRLPAC